MKRHTIDLAEKRRIQLQQKLDSNKTRLERNILGQFATPPGLAQEIVNYIYDNRLLSNQNIRFFDPALGTGSFFSALLQKIPKDNIESAMGIEIDGDFASVAKELWAEYGLEVKNNDFTLMNPPQNESQLVNLILTNPPYVRHHHIKKREKLLLQKNVKTQLGYNISGLAGLYCYFLLLSHSWLRKGGYGIWLIPSEFMDVNYGAIVKKYLTEKVTLIHIHRFEANDVQFADALVSSSIVIFQKRKQERNEKAIFSYGGSLLHPNEYKSILIHDLPQSQKWTQLFNKTLPSTLDKNQGAVKLADLFKIQRGIATGANKFFIMTRTKAESLGMPEEFLKPILPSPRYLQTEIIESDREGYPLMDDQLVVIDCNLPKNLIETNYRELFKYLEDGEESGLKERYLLKNRFPWYKQEQRDPVPFLCTYMGRSSRRNGPFRLFWNKSKAISTNVYLLLYPIGELSEMLNRNPELHMVLFKTLKEIIAEEMIGNGRVYGGGLHKAEPKELGTLSAKKVVEIMQSHGCSPRSQQSQTELSTYT